VADIRLAAINLNLLPALDAVLQECHVTRAAARLGVTQSAMSYTLGRLRDLLDDPLLVRGPHGMVRTARGEELAPKVRAALEGIERALEPGRFDPATSARGFSIATADSNFHTTVLPLMKRLEALAPSVDLRLSLLGLRPFEERLEAGEIDMALGLGFEDHPSIRREVLYVEPYSCAVRQDHPSIGDEITVEQFAAAAHVIVTRKTTPQRTMIDQQLADRDLERRIAMQVPSYPWALSAARTTDIVVSGPRRFLRAAGAEHGLRVMDHPLTETRLDVCMMWHIRTERDPANRWLRAQIVAAVEEAGADTT